MTHKELLAKIDAFFAEIPVNYGQIYVHNALRAVVELHKPMYYDTHPTLQCPCGHCEHREWDVWPCPTIQAIEKELN